VTAVEPATERQPQSAAAPSPFPPLAESAFLSNCHTGALVAPDGAIDWLCVPRFDSPSVFGSLLDREAGFFRFGPFGINHPDRCRLPAGHECARDDVEDTERLDRRPRRADDEPAFQMARDLMERLLRVASPLGLYAEEFDAATGRHLGNFPQAFSHLALMEAAGRIMLTELTAEV
jgi:GH15 family glucan-1,4-alpha-glucosidase